MVEGVLSRSYVLLHGPPLSRTTLAAARMLKDVLRKCPYMDSRIRLRARSSSQRQCNDGPTLADLDGLAGSVHGQVARRHVEPGKHHAQRIVADIEPDLAAVPLAIGDAMQLAGLNRNGAEQDHGIFGLYGLRLLEAGRQRAANDA